ncbi:MAG: hypothetical protein H7338_06665 [Candidatus Sericytochromatia bacterium]|nr:hypothetical protein [Candidatus Sericytochromatia bacterium]
MAQQVTKAQTANGWGVCIRVDPLVLTPDSARQLAEEILSVAAQAERTERAHSIHHLVRFNSI